MAWLNAVPKPDASSKRGKDPARHPKISRLDALRKRKVAPAMPPSPMPHIIDRLTEIGLTEAAGMGVGPIGWATIDAWARRTAIDILPWEAKLLRRLSIAYVTESRKAESENCPAPWHAPVSQREIETEVDTLVAVLG